MSIYVPDSKFVSVSVSYIDAGATTFYVQDARLGSVDYIAAAFTPTYVQVKVMAETTMPDVLAVEVITPIDDAVFAFAKKLTDSQVLRDEAIRAVNKALADSAVPSEHISHINTSKKLSDTQVLSEALLYTFNKGTISDTSIASDKWKFGLSKVVIPDTLSPADDITSLAFDKALSDYAVMEDDVDIDYWLEKLLGDSQSIADALAHSFTKSLTIDEVIEIDAILLYTSKALEDSFGPPVETVALDFTKALADVVTMSDAANTYKIFIRVFEDDLTVPDTDFWEFVSSVTEETAAASDVYNHIMTKNIFDSTVLIDNMDGDIQYAFIKLIGELLTSSDSKVVDFTANKSDNVTSSDGGMLYMQDYCDITYFLEDYVGTSRTF